LLNNTVVQTIYDSGANISCINYSLLDKLKLKVFKYKNEKLTFNTINNTNSYLGRVSVCLTIGSITEKCVLIVIKNSFHDLVLGLDLINKFKLKMLENYKIFQTYEINNELIEEEIASNYSINSQTNFDSNESNELKINLNDLQTNANINSNLKLNECLNDKQYIILKNILTKYSTVFSRDKFDLGSINIEQCKIELTNNVPINLRPYRCSQSDQKNN
jgi:hypothetical protein